MDSCLFLSRPNWLLGVGLFGAAAAFAFFVTRRLWLGKPLWRQGLNERTKFLSWLSFGPALVLVLTPFLTDPLTRFTSVLIGAFGCSGFFIHWHYYPLKRWRSHKGGQKLLFASLLMGASGVFSVLAGNFKTGLAFAALLFYRQMVLVIQRSVETSEQIHALRAKVLLLEAYHQQASAVSYASHKIDDKRSQAR